MSAIEELREALEALWEVTVQLAYICERNGMNYVEGAAITDAYKRYAKAMGKEWHDERD